MAASALARLVLVQPVSRAGERLLIDLELTNDTPDEEFFRARLLAPDGWAVTPDEIEVSVYAGQSGVVTFGLRVPDAASGQFDIAADVTFGQVRLPRIVRGVLIGW